jgi:hypothetical protein
MIKTLYQMDNIMPKYFLFIAFIFLITSCISTQSTPKTVEGSNPYSVEVPKKKMVLVDMGYVEGTIKEKRIHAYRIAYNTGIGVANDHIYVLEDGQIDVVQPEGKTTKHISVIIENDTFELKKK